MAAEQDAASEFKIRNRAMEGREVVLQIERREADAIGVLHLGDVVKRNEINGIFQVSLWRLEQDPSHSNSRLKHSGVAASTRDAMTASNEELSFIGPAWDLVLSSKRADSRQHKDDEQCEPDDDGERSME